MKTVLYCRVSTADQLLEHQFTQAEAAGFRLDEVVSDLGVSGVTTALGTGPRGGGSSISSAPVTLLSCVGWTGLAEITGT